MASTSQVQARYDSTSTHLLSEKAIVEGWDTFIFYAELIQPGALIIGLNTKRFHLSTKDVARWLSVMSHGPPPTIYRCTVESVSILHYLPSKVESDPVDWNSSDVWEPGNFMVESLGNTHHWGIPGSIRTLSEQERNETQERALASPAESAKPLFSIDVPGCSSKSLLWIVFPESYLNYSSDPETNHSGHNLIWLPTVLEDEFKNNNFGFDLEMGCFITFPTISPEAESLLQNATLQITDAAQTSFLEKHFSLCLEVHCERGDLNIQYDRSALATRLDEWEDSIPDFDVDTLDVAIRAHFINYSLSNAELE